MLTALSVRIQGVMPQRIAQNRSIRGKKAKVIFRQIDSVFGAD
jgi:hypothetical protein